MARRRTTSAPMTARTAPPNTKYMGVFNLLLSDDDESETIGMDCSRSCLASPISVSFKAEGADVMVWATGSISTGDKVGADVVATGLSVSESSDPAAIVARADGARVGGVGDVTIMDMDIDREPM